MNPAKKYFQLLRKYERAEEQLKKLYIEMMQQKSLAGIDDELPVVCAETPEDYMQRG